jgi:hypothetical protein
VGGLKPPPEGRLRRAKQPPSLLQHRSQRDHHLALCPTSCVRVHNPGGDNPDARDPILDAVELSNRGYPDRGRALLDGLVDWDVRCIDAHAHLGGLAFHEDDIEEAQAHYATGVRVAEASLPDGFGGVLGWGWIDNRPFLRCLHGLTISTWRLEQHAEAHELCQALLWPNPADNQRARELLPEISAGAPWPNSR